MTVECEQVAVEGLFVDALRQTILSQPLIELPEVIEGGFYRQFSDEIRGFKTEMFCTGDDLESVSSFVVEMFSGHVPRRPKNPGVVLYHHARRSYKPAFDRAREACEGVADAFGEDLLTDFPTERLAWYAALYAAAKVVLSEKGALNLLSASYEDEGLRKFLGYELGGVSQDYYEDVLSEGGSQMKEYLLAKAEIFYALFTMRDKDFLELVDDGQDDICLACKGSREEPGKHCLQERSPIAGRDSDLLYKVPLGWMAEEYPHQIEVTDSGNHRLRMDLFFDDEFWKKLGKKMVYYAMDFH